MSSDMKSQMESMSEQVSKMETSVKTKMAKPLAVEEAAADEGKTNEKKYDCQEDDVVYMYRIANRHISPFLNFQFILFSMFFFFKI